ncbi:metal-dependent transcriptional regulator [Xylanivirga thermophila]|jgi:DtxR family Mn-dependent transcriptional regulator|uniref:metal-dependent transcriptional regulator n=1 Tax=Xylanivirga thermophila TaxID=2496273 RepID=UPI00101E1543|nr:metal-dependent transcriptional regulator [Xylanivirga thermophila]
MNQIDISPSLQDYLETILNLSNEYETVRVTDLAQEMNVAKSSVHQAVTQLKKTGLVEQEPYGPLILTKEGENIAKKVLEKHHLLVKFFTEVLDVDYNTAQKDACLIEHSISPVTVEKLINFLEHYIQEN